MPSEVALVFFWGGGIVLCKDTKNITHNFWSCRKSSVPLRSENNSNLDSIGYQVMKSKTNKKNIMKKD